MKRNISLLSLLLCSGILALPWDAKEPYAVHALEDANEPTSVKGMKRHNTNVLTFVLSQTDYAGAQNYVPGSSYREFNFLTNVDIVLNDGSRKTLEDAFDGAQMYYQMWRTPNAFSLSLHQTDYNNLAKVVIHAGTVFPSMAYTGYAPIGTSNFTTKGSVKKGFEVEREIVYTYASGVDLVTKGALIDRGNIHISNFTYGQGDVDKGNPDLFFYSEDANWPSAPQNELSGDALTEYYNTYCNKDFSALSDSLNYLDKIRLDGKTLRELGTPDLQMMCYRTVWNSLTISAPTYHGGTDLNTVEVEAGCQLPAFSSNPYEAPYYTVETAVTFGRTGETFQLVGEIANPEHQIEDDVLSWDEEEDDCLIRIPFQMTGPNQNMGALEDSYGTLIRLNGKPISDINATRPDRKIIKAHYEFVGNRYQFVMTIAKDYAGILNPSLQYVGNVIELAKGLPTPGGVPLNATYRIHRFKGSSITDRQEENESFDALSVNTISSYVPADLTNNDTFLYITFDQEITGSPIYYVTSPRHFCENEVKRSNTRDYTFFEENRYNAFVSGGFQSSVLEKLLLQGKPIYQWMAEDDTLSSPVSVMGHYGQSANNVFSLSFSHRGTSNAKIAELIQNGQLTLTFLPGYRFPSGNEIKKTQTFRLVEQIWREEKVADSYAVYYDGKAVADGVTLESSFAPDSGKIRVDGLASYVVEEQAEAEGKQFTVKQGETTLLSFHIRYVPQPNLNFTSSSSSVGLVIGITVPAGIVVLSAIILPLILRKRRKAK